MNGSCLEAVAASPALHDSDEDDVDEDFGELEETDEEEHEDGEIEEDSDDCEFPELDEIRLTALAGKLREENMKNLKWARNRFTPPDVTFDDVRSEEENIPTPLAYFFKYFPNSVFELMEKTNTYPVHTNGKCIDASV
ncbi:unnamed protein product [Cylicocyclus nassatus]|uniref:Uncharacterized protein n=1 Tax=Cylicocyclus nassatus TaxID=53992 RepID=A0AA36M6G4_CYLNA|nr:unnamed protein product [Cylicocyclus nassatus]